MMMKDDDDDDKTQELMSYFKQECPRSPRNLQSMTCKNKIQED